MTTRTNHPQGVPCWVDLWTSDVEGSRRFYGELFGWDSEPPNPDYGGYFSFLRNGERIAGAMGDMGTPDGEFFMPANDTWKPYLAVDDIAVSVERSRAAGAEVFGGPHAVGDLGHQAVLSDPTGGHLGLWQAGTHPGFTTLDEPGAPSWFELHTRDHARAVAFYHDVFGIETETVSDTDEFRYTTLNGPSGCGQVAGIMDSTSWLPDDVPAFWTVYWCTDDVDASVVAVTSLGGSVVTAAEDTPYGRVVAVADPAGAIVRLRTPPTGAAEIQATRAG